jgi:hypothetical protein
LVLFLGSYLAVADTVFDTFAVWDGSVYMNPFGHSSNTSTYGQAITAPLTDSVLKTFTFYMEQDTAIVFRGEVYAWDGAEATGPNLWESGPMSTTNPNIFEPIEFDTGGLALTGGQDYVMFASVDKDPGSAGGGHWGWMLRTQTYPGSYSTWFDDGDNASLWTTQAWDGTNVFPGSQFAFKADFGPAGPQVPEPGTMALLAMGLVGIVAKRRKR